MIFGGHSGSFEVLVLKSFAKSLDPSTHQIQTIAGVPSLKGDRVSKKLTQTTTFTNTNERDLEEHIKDINFMFKSVVKCLTGRYVLISVHNCVNLQNSRF